MKIEKSLLFYLFVILILVVTSIYLLLSTTNFISNRITLPYTNCTIFNEISRPNRMLILGKVTNINQDNPEWIITSVQLCDNNISNPSDVSIDVYTPTAQKLFYSGKKTKVNSKDSYQWHYKKIDDFSSFIKVDDLVVVNAESLIKEDLLDSFNELENFNCSEEPICYPLMEFISNYNGNQFKLIKNIKAKNAYGLLTNKYQNKNIVYSNRFGTIDSYQELKEYANNLIIW
jgi:hypothetical protein